MISYIKDGEDLIAILVPNDFTESGIHFLTPNGLSQQMAHMQHPAGKIIESHIHFPIDRQINFTQEALFIRKGKVEVDLYNKNQKHISTHTLIAGDVILLVSGGHGFKITEDADIIEIKQGPYFEGQDKIRFKGIR